MPQSVVDTWARDLATEAKETAVAASVHLEVHERHCNERHGNLMQWQTLTYTKIDALRRDLWRLSLSGITVVLGALAAVTWTLVRAQAGLP